MRSFIVSSGLFILETLRDERMTLRLRNDGGCSRNGRAVVRMVAGRAIRSGGPDDGLSGAAALGVADHTAEHCLELGDNLPPA